MASTIQNGVGGLYLKDDQEAVTIAPRATTGTGIMSGSFIGFDTSGSGTGLLANSHSGSEQLPAVGFALAGENVGQFTTKLLEQYDAIDNPQGIGQLNSGSVYQPGAPVWLSGTGTEAVNYSVVVSNNLGDIVQQVGVIVESTGQFRIKIGTPFITGVSGTLIPWTAPLVGAA